MSYLCRTEQPVRAKAYAGAPDEKLNAPSRGIQFCRTSQPGLCVSGMTIGRLRIQYGFFATVYQIRNHSNNVSTDAVNEEKKCLVKSGKVSETENPSKFSPQLA